jgi:hypothetical protein
MSPSSPRPIAPTTTTPAQPVLLPPGTKLPPGQPVIVVQQAPAGPAGGVIGPAVQGGTGPQPFDPHTNGRHREVSETEQKAAQDQELLVYSHSNFFYWWPVWVTGYIMALITWLHAQPVQLGDTKVLIDTNKNLGVIFTLMFFLVVLITTVTMRGLASVVAILSFAFGVLLLAYLGWWETVLNWMGEVRIYMNMGFYVFFSTLVFLVWVFSVFIYDRLAYWKVRPGQITHERVIGGAERSYDTRGMVFEKHREDLFRHWIIGMGSGDIKISTTGAKRDTIYVPNVLLVDSKIDAIQRMISVQPDQFTSPAA